MSLLLALGFDSPASFSRMSRNFSATALSSVCSWDPAKQAELNAVADKLGLCDCCLLLLLGPPAAPGVVAGSPVQPM